MSQSIHERIKNLIEGTHEAFNDYGPGNADFAEFAAMAISEFKSALQKPDLTARELRQLLRKGQTSHRDENPEGCWATFMAQYVSRNSNANIRDAVSYGLDEVYKEKQH